MRLQLLILTASLAPLAVIACGGGGGSTGGGGGGTTSTTTSTSSTTSSDTGSSTTSSSTTSSSTTSSSTTSSSTGPADQCTNAADLALVTTNDMQKIGSDCALANIDFATGTLKEPGLTDCIKNLNGTSDAGTLSDGCSACFSATVHCAAETCGTSCNPLKGGNPTSQACTDCRAAMCDPAFAACSGLP